MSNPGNAVLSFAKRAAKKVENTAKYPYRYTRKQVLRRRVKLERDSVSYVAHRGLSALAPENTLAAFRLAAEVPFDSMETDIRRTRDGKLVLMHDASLKRMCGLDVLVKDLTLEEIRAIPVIGGNHPDQYTDDPDALRVPLLTEFLEVCRDSGMVPMLELKDNWDVKEPLPYDYLEDVIKEVTGIMEDRPVIYVSFNLRSLVRMKKMYDRENKDNVTFCHLVQTIDLSRLSTYKRHGINLSVNGKKNKLMAIKKVKEAGLSEVIWTVDDPDQARLYITANVDWIASNGRLWE
ncbi:MAG: hypothetical protein IJ137_01380 [Eubacterium sp.]|nr:hypothetical protein [Eubacterium sp.]